MEHTGAGFRDGRLDQPFSIGKGKMAKKSKAPATILFGSAVSPEGDKQLCVWAMCEMSNARFGPVWGHSENSIKRALASLTKECDCPARFHNARDFQGKRVIIKKRKKTSRR
jgi:hypothetical protein